MCGGVVRGLRPAPPAEGHPELFAVVEEVLFGAALGAAPVGHLLIGPINLPGVGAFDDLCRSAGWIWLARVGRRPSFGSTLDHGPCLVDSLLGHNHSQRMTTS